MASNILQFDPTRLITAINIVDDMLFYSDGVTEPKKINIKKFRGDDTTGEFSNVNVDHSSGITYIYGRRFEERDITVIKGKGSLKKSLEVSPAPKPIGIRRDDVNLSDIPNKIIEIVTDSPQESPERGKAVISATENDLNRITINSQLKWGGGRLRDAGFVWTQNADSASALQESITSTVTGNNLVRSTINSNESGYANISLVIDKNNTTSPFYNSTIVAGPLYAIAWGQLYSQEKGESYFQSEILDIEIIDPSVSTTAPTGLITLGEKNIGGGIFEFCARYDTNGGKSLSKIGFLVSEGLINENDPAPTVQDLLNSGYDIPAEQRESEIYVKERPVPGKTYYYVPYIENENGRIYGDGLTESSTVIKKYREPGIAEPNVSTKTVKQVSLHTGDTNFSNTSSKLFLEGSFNGNKQNRVQLHPNSNITEFGFYFSKSNTTSLNDLTNKTFNSGSTVSTDGKVFKVPVPSPDLENGGLHKLDISNLITLEPEEQVFYVAYIKHTGGETVGAPVSYFNPRVATVPVFRIVDSVWDLKPNTVNSNGMSPINVGFNIDVTEFPPNKTIKDIGIYVSRPATQNEIMLSKNGRWSYLNEVINTNNSQSNSVNQSGLTFTANGGHASIGRYNTTSPIEMPAMTAEHYKFLLRKGIKPLNEDWAAVAYIVDSDGNTHYSRVFNYDSDASNIDSNLIKPILGAPKVETIKAESVLNTTATLTGSLPNTGKNIAEIGFYVSTTPPPALSTIDSEIPGNLSDGRNPHLDAWISGATKHASSTTTTTANNHLNQTFGFNNTNDLEFKANITGLAANTRHYYVAYVKPVQTTNSENDIIYAGDETINNIINSNHYGEIGDFTTTETVTSVAANPILKIFPITPALALTKTAFAASYYVTPNSDNNIINNVGIYVKPASLFPASGTGSSAQTTNASTMLNASNRLQFTSPEWALGHTVRGFDIASSTASATGIDTVEYYVALFADVLLSNGTTQQFVSDYISVDNSVNATTGGSAGAVAAIPELNFFTIGPVDYTKFELNPFVDQLVAQETNRIGANFKFEKIPNSTAAPAPEIDKAGFLLIHPPISKPTSVTNFVSVHGNSSNASNVSTIESTGDITRLSNGLEGHFSGYVPFFENFPSSYVGNTYYIVAFIRYKETQEIKYSDKIEELFIHDPRIGNGSGRYYGNAFASINEIYWHKSRPNALVMTVRDGVRLETGTDRLKANEGTLFNIATGGDGRTGVQGFAKVHIKSSRDWFPFYYATNGIKTLQPAIGANKVYGSPTQAQSSLWMLDESGARNTSRLPHDTPFEVLRQGNTLKIFSPHGSINGTGKNWRKFDVTHDASANINYSNNKYGYWYIIYILPEAARFDLGLNDISIYYGSGGSAYQGVSPELYNYGQALLEENCFTKITVGFKTFQDIPVGMR
ncbi:MAG: hypothetical protein CMP37_03645 [Rickettsiales bacterium]|nr:hypothetical protein [Rickettsiales bacterium]|tara:strand:+ start:1383 stop:5612 length:4230 start_codon:yes stop_codon:yes gene_type:complete